MPACTHTYILALLQEFIVAYAKHYFRCAAKKKKTRFLCANKRAEIYGKDSNGFHTYISFLFMLHILYIFGF